MIVPRLALALGDPAGIGPDIASRLFAEATSSAEAGKGVCVAGARFDAAPANDPEAAAAGRASRRDFRARARGAGFDIQGRGVARVGALGAAFGPACAMAAARRRRRAGAC